MSVAVRNIILCRVILSWLIRLGFLIRPGSPRIFGKLRSNEGRKEGAPLRRRTGRAKVNQRPQTATVALPTVIPHGPSQGEVMFQLGSTKKNTKLPRYPEVSMGIQRVCSARSNFVPLAPPSLRPPRLPPPLLEEAHDGEIKTEPSKACRCDEMDPYTVALCRRPPFAGTLGKIPP